MYAVVFKTLNTWIGLVHAKVICAPIEVYRSVYINKTH